MGYMQLMSARGDENVLKWGSSSAERAIAKETFDKYIAKGFAMFRMTEDDEQGAKITTFDPEAHGILAVPRMQGG